MCSRGRVPLKSTQPRQSNHGKVTTSGGGRAVAFNSGQCGMSPLLTSRNLSACFKPAHLHKEGRDELALPDLNTDGESRGEQTEVASRSNRCISALTLRDTSDPALMKDVGSIKFHTMRNARLH